MTRPGSNSRPITGLKICNRLRHDAQRQHIRADCSFGFPNQSPIKLSGACRRGGATRRLAACLTGRSFREPGPDSWHVQPEYLPKQKPLADAIDARRQASSQNRNCLTGLSSLCVRRSPAEQGHFLASCKCPFSDTRELLLRDFNQALRLQAACAPASVLRRAMLPQHPARSTLTHSSAWACT